MARSYEAKEKEQNFEEKGIKTKSTPTTILTISVMRSMQGSLSVTSSSPSDIHQKKPAMEPEKMEIGWRMSVRS